MIGTVENPKIYGAGLLSSIGESAWCMTDQVKKTPYSIEAAHTPFDITKPQPQLFVTPDFAFLSQVLEDFANTMALRTGGLKGIRKLINSKEMGTIELSTGLQVSGNFEMVIEHNNQAVFFQTVGPTALAYREKELVGHGIENHANGFGSPLGKLKGINLAIEDMGPRDLKAYNIYEGETIALEFEGDIAIKGEIVTGTRNLRGEIILVTFKNCEVRQKDTVLFESKDELYNMAIGENIVSAFNGPADLNSFDLVNHKITEATIKPQKSTERIHLEQLYQQVRDFRIEKKTISRNKVFKELINNHPDDWLLCVELYELAKMNPEIQKEQVFATEIKNHLEMVKQNNPNVGRLIDDGLALVDQKLVN